MNKIDELRKQIAEIQKEDRKKASEKYYNDFKKFEGKCYKYKDSYSRNEWWYGYKKINKIYKNTIEIMCDDSIVCRAEAFKFSTDSMNEIRIRTEKDDILTLGEEYMKYYEEISKEEFNDELNKIITKLQKNIKK